MRSLLVLLAAAAIVVAACESTAPTPQPTPPASAAPAPTSAAPASAGASQSPAALIGTGSFVEYPTIADYQAAGGTAITAFTEAPALADQVKAGALPKVQDRLPKDVAVVAPADGIGSYGGTLRVTRSDALEELLYEFPFSYDNALKSTHPNIIKGYDVNGDATEFTFHLREGMKWSDGQPVTADDWVEYYNHILVNNDFWPGGRSEYKTSSGVGTILKVDDYTIKYTFKEPYGLFPYVLSRTYDYIAPWHYVKQCVDGVADPAALKAAISDAGVPDWQSLFKAKADPAFNPDLPSIFPWVVTTGPEASVAVLARNPYYWKVDPAGNQLPYLDAVQGDTVEGQPLVVKALAGELDFASGGALDLQKNFPIVKENEAKNIYRLVPLLAPAIGVGNITFNYGITDDFLRGLFNNLEFRQALSVGTDRAAINGTMFNGLLVPSQWSPSDGPPYNGDSEQFRQFVKFDPVAANAALDKLGLTWNADHSVRLRPDGKPFELVMFVNPMQETIDAVGMAELIKAQWAKDLGIQVVIKPVEKDAYNFAEGTLQGIHLDAFEMSREFPLAATQSMMVPVGSDWPVFGPWAAWLESGGSAGIEPPADVKQLYSLFVQYQAGADPAKLIDLENQMYALHAKNMWVVGLLKMPTTYPTNVDLVGVKVGNVPAVMPRERNYQAIETWFLKP